MNKGYIKAAGLMKLFDDIEKDMPSVPWEAEVKAYLKSIKKMARNLIEHGEDIMKAEVLEDQKVVFVPASYGKPKKDDIYEIIRRVKNHDKVYIVKDVVWLRDGEWVAMNGQKIDETEVEAWELKGGIS